MAYSLVHTGLRLLPLLAALLLPPLAQADRGHYRDHQRLQQYGQPYGHYRSQGNYRRGQQGYRHRDERRHKAYRHYRKHKHYRHGNRVRVIERYYYSAPRRYTPPRYNHLPRAGISVVLPLGHFIRELPGGYISLHFNGNPYYYQGGNYYRPYQRGYRVVAPPGRSPNW